MALVRLGTHVICYHFLKSEGKSKELRRKPAFCLLSPWILPSFSPMTDFSQSVREIRNEFQLRTQLVPTQGREKALWAHLILHLQILGQLCQPVGVMNFTLPL